MLIDNELDLTGGKIIDLGQAENSIGIPQTLSVAFVATADVSTATTFTIQECATKAGTYANLMTVGPVAALKRGQVVQFPLPPRCKQFIKTTNTTNFNAFLTMGRQLWKAEKEAESIHTAPIGEQAS